MNARVDILDRLRRAFQSMSRRAAAARIAYWLTPRTPEELERRRAYLLGLLLVAIVGTAKHVTGLTDGSAQYTGYALAIAFTALFGGVAPACAATMGAILLVDAEARSSIASAANVVFALEGLGVAVLVGGARRRLRAAAAQLTTRDAINEALGRQVRRGHLAHDAFEHLEDIAADAAVFIVNAEGSIVEWPRSAARMYGVTAEQALGSSLATVCGDASILPTAHTPGETAHRSGVHRRSDGTPVPVEFHVKPCGSHGAEHFTVAVHDLSRRREAEAFGDAAFRAQEALQLAADEARDRLESLESLTDPLVSAVNGDRAIDELLERLRATVRAEGVALVQLGRTATRIVAGAGLSPAGGAAPRREANVGATADSRVALVHNDAARVAQVSALRWPPTVSSLLVVPVCHSGPIAFSIEVVNERRAPATEWDLALARIVADRLAYAMLLHTPADSADSVA
jgi:PAS domain S-box-containing protein